jgi:hypothetical protein
MLKVVKFTPALTELIKQGKKVTTFRLFDDKDLSVGDEIELATRDGEVVTVFGRAIITEVILRSIETLQPEDYTGHEPIKDPLADYRNYYGDKVQLDTEVKIVRFKVEELFSHT